MIYHHHPISPLWKLPFWSIQFMDKASWQMTLNESKPWHPRYSIPKYIIGLGPIPSWHQKCRKNRTQSPAAFRSASAARLPSYRFQCRSSRMVRRCWAVWVIGLQTTWCHRLCQLALLAPTSSPPDNALALRSSGADLTSPHLMTDRYLSWPSTSDQHGLDEKAALCPEGELKGNTAQLLQRFQSQLEK